MQVQKKAPEDLTAKKALALEVIRGLFLYRHGTNLL